ncbi:MAG: hypothetical protein IPJ13_26310 [Saprospiraceae bacterium]|nr:hypothetical protein [Saprospiraceae bacterium]
MKLNIYIMRNCVVLLLSLMLSEIKGQDCSICQKQLLLKVNEIEQLAIKLDVLENNEKSINSQLITLQKKVDLSIDETTFNHIKKQNSIIQRKLSQSKSALSKSNSDNKKIQKNWIN